MITLFSQYNIRLVRCFSILFLLLLMSSTLFSASSSAADACHDLYGSDSRAPSGYGLSWNPLSPAKEVLVRTQGCSAGAAAVIVGSDANTLFTYAKGYYWTGTGWKPYTLAPTAGSTQTDDWIMGTGSATVTLSDSPTYVLGYTCQQAGSAWKCGCASSSCTTGLWHLQAIEAPHTAANTIAFAQTRSSAREADSDVSIPVTFAGSGAATVEYRVIRTQARNHGRCSPQDFELEAGTLSFTAPGERSIILHLHDDALQEADEEIVIALSSPHGAELGSNTTHTFTIVDDDRRNIASVKDYGAIGDGVADDRAAIQTTIDRISALGGGVILFPPGEYLVSDAVHLRENLTLVGYGATTTRLPHQGKWEVTFDMTTWSQNRDTLPIVLQGLRMDGNSQNQGPYQDHELQQAHLLFLFVRGPGRVQALIEDMTFQNGTGDGVSAATNVDLKMCHIRMHNVFRGGLTISGGHTSAYVFDFEGDGSVDATGMDIEPEGSNPPVDLVMERIRFRNGDFDLALGKEGEFRQSSFTGRDIVSLAGRFDMHTRFAKVRISDSEFHVGVEGTSIENRIFQPGDVVFDHVTFVATEEPFDATKDLVEADRRLKSLSVLWNNAYNPHLTGQRLLCRNCAFEIAANVEPSDDVYATYTLGVISASDDNQVTLENPKFTGPFAGVFGAPCVACVEKAGTGEQGRRPVDWGDVVSWFGMASQ
ncbi:MAG: hypothetical protein JNM75_05515 [Rhodospirillales bacterium]|nr:hypothetical protein [Rhodospirillales bacterium]